MKVTSRKDLINILKENGYILVANKKHEKWIRLDDIVSIPRKHSKGFSRMLAEGVLRRAKYINHLEGK